MALARSANPKLPPDANRVLFVKNLNYKTTGEDLYDLFGKYGAIRQIRLGTEGKAKGTAYVVMEDIFDAKAAYDGLNGFNMSNRYLVVLFHQAAKLDARAEIARREKELAEAKAKYSIPEEA